MTEKFLIIKNINQALNQYQGDIIKPTLPSQFVKIAESADDSSAYLFGEFLTEKMDRLQKESRIIYLMKNSKSTPKQSYGKRTYQTFKLPNQDSSNYQSSSKTKKTTKKGQNYTKEQTHAQNNNQKFRRQFQKS